jgi:hypothetical protein
VKSKKYLLITAAIILAVVVCFISHFKSGYINVTTKYFDKNTIKTIWYYQYTDKYNKSTNKWDFKNSHLYILKKGKWEIEKSNTLESEDNIAHVKLNKKSQGEYIVQVKGYEKNKRTYFYDKFIIDCATSKITEGN